MTIDRRVRWANFRCGIGHAGYSAGKVLLIAGGVSALLEASVRLSEGAWPRVQDLIGSVRETNLTAVDAVTARLNEVPLSVYLTLIGLATVWVSTLIWEQARSTLRRHRRTYTAQSPRREPWH